MESEQLTNFNDRLNQWISSQGFWFQLRYSITSGGSRGALMFQLFNAGLRLLIFLAIVGIALAAYLVKRPNTNRFKAELKESIKAGLSGTEVEIRGASRVQGQLGIARIACQGGDGSFFSSLEAKNIQSKMGLLDGVLGQWDMGAVGISILNLELKAGADDGDSAKKLADAFFRKWDSVSIQSLDIGDASLQWGYSEPTRGGIEHCSIKIQRGDQFMKIVVKGGRFHQNWLQGLEIVNLTIACDPNGMTFEKAELRAGEGTVDFSGLKVIGGERPMLDGVVKIRKLAMEHTLPDVLDGFVEGSISGDFTVSGSTNTAEGVSFAGKVTLDGDDTISLREKFHVLRALSVVDYVRNYHRLDFRKGSFQLKTKGGGLVIEDLSIQTDDHFSLEGNVAVRLPTLEEAQAAVAKNTIAGGTPLFANETSGMEKAGKADGGDFSLRRAAMEEKKVKQEQDALGGNVSLLDRMSLAFEARDIEKEEVKRISGSLRYSGTLKVTLPPDAFERAPKLATQLPVDADLGRIPLMIPIEGTLYELTLKQAEEIYQLGIRKD